MSWLRWVGLALTAAVVGTLFMFGLGAAVRRLRHRYLIWRTMRRIKRSGPPVYLGQTYDPSAPDYVEIPR